MGFDDISDRTKRTASETMASVKEKLAASGIEDMEDVKAAAAELAEDAATFVRKYPLQSLFGALALGFLVGSTLRRK